jgi:hypothetical protein
MFPFRQADKDQTMPYPPEYAEDDRSNMTCPESLTEEDKEKAPKENQEANIIPTRRRISLEDVRQFLHRLRPQCINKSCCLEWLCGILCWVCCFSIIAAIALPILLIYRGAGELGASWPNDGHGLTVTVINSCDYHWHDIFNEYIQLWDDGSPDSLRLVTEERHPEYGYCETVYGRINVCNGNYGYTGWIGITHTWAYQGNITQAVVKLNDFYTNSYVSEKRNLNEKKYVMCHELGHAWGLPHSDERWRNIDLRECMDYTIRPRNNLLPGKVNFEKLEQLYGTFDEYTTFSAAARATNDTTTKNLRTPPPQAAVSTMEEDESASLPESVRQVYTVLMECLETKSCSECREELASVINNSTQGVHDKTTEGSEECEFHLDGEYSLQTHKLLAHQ